MPESIASQEQKNAALRTYEDVMRHLDGLGMFHMDMGLDRMRAALSRLELADLKCPVVQVVGTNGKGSTSVFLQSIAMAHGMRAALYTSPHFVRPDERIRVDLTELPPRAWPLFAAKALDAEPGLTYFELLTVIAAQAFKASSPDLAIFEAGLGARHDATTALPAEMVCFTPIDLDHTNVLGPTIYDVAADKADALRTGVSMAVSAPQEKTPWAILSNQADDTGIPLCSLSPEGLASNEGGEHLWALLPNDLRQLTMLGNGVKLGLKGPHQLVNAQTAVLAWILLCLKHGWKTNRMAIEHGLEQAFIPGRLQFVPEDDTLPSLWLDGAHNAHGMEALGKALHAMQPEEKPGSAVFSCLADKEPAKLVQELKRALDGAPVFIPTIRDNARAAKAEDLAALFGAGATAEPCLSQALADARGAAGGRPVIICGSLYLLSEFYREHPSLLLHPRKRESLLMKSSSLSY